MFGARQTLTAFEAFLLLVAGASLFACSAALPTPNDAQLKSAQKLYPESSIESLNEGRRLYVQKCSGCHNLHLPQELEAARWQEEVHNMVSSKGVVATEDETQQILHYLVGASRPTTEN
jgi:cytochrome c5